MAIIKVAKGGQSIKSAIRYAGREDITQGKDLSDNKEQAIEEMKITKEIYNKTDGRQYKHYIQSFAVGEVDVQKAQKIGLEFAEKNFKGYEVFIGTHTDREHIHNHLIVNSVNFETGGKFNVPKSFLETLRKSNDAIALKYDLKLVKGIKVQGEVRGGSVEKYRVLMKAFNGEGKSYLLENAKAVKKVASISRDKSEFIKNMSELGYKTNWTENRKHITFEKDGNKVRLSNLEKTFTDELFSKGGLENEFKRNVEREREQGNRIDDRTRGNIKGDEEIKRADEGIHISSDRQAISSEADSRQRTYENTRDEQETNGLVNSDESKDIGTNEFNFEEAREFIERERKSNSINFGEVNNRDREEQSKDSGRTKEHQGDSERGHERDKKDIEQRNTCNRTKDKGHSFER